MEFGNNLKPIAQPAKLAKPSQQPVDPNEMFEIILDTVDEDDDEGYIYNKFLNYLKKNNIRQEKFGTGGGGWPSMRYIAQRGALEKMIKKYFDNGEATTPEEWRKLFDNQEYYGLKPYKHKGIK